jgi:uncharacterized protein YecE (DUF72 family)
MVNIRIGCAGWPIPRESAAAFPVDGSHLERYAGRFHSVEINSSFYRPHRRGTYARWADSVPEKFMFNVKMPQEITHKQRLVDAEDSVTRFLLEVQGLGTKLGPLLVQLPPSLKFDLTIARQFFDALRSRFEGDVALESRHATWFEPDAGRVIDCFQIGRVAADPAVVPAAAEPGGCTRVVYYRLHGSPRMYYSSYDADDLSSLVAKLLGHSDAQMVWCIFDNTAAGAATENALHLLEMVQGPGRSTACD